MLGLKPPCPRVPYAGPHAWPRHTAGMCRPAAAAPGINNQDVPAPAAPPANQTTLDAAPVGALTEIKAMVQEMEVRVAQRVAQSVADTLKK